MTVEYWYEGHLMDELSPHGHFFDYFGADEPEHAMLPMTYWTKERMIVYARQSKNCNAKSLQILKSMSLVDMKILVLKDEGVLPTGSIRSLREDGADDSWKRWRHTKFYSMNFDFIKNLGESE